MQKHTVIQNSFLVCATGFRFLYGMIINIFRSKIESIKQNGKQM